MPTTRTLVAAQVMLTLILLAGSVSVGGAFLHLMHADRGYDTKGLLAVSVALDGTIHKTEKHQLAYFDEALRRLRQLPGVREASLTEFLPLGVNLLLGAPFTMDGRQTDESSMIVPILPRYFETMGGRLLYGRDFTDAEVRTDAPVAIVNERFVAEFGHSYDAIGREVRLGTSQKRKIIGVVRATDYMTDVPNPKQIFVPDQSPGNFSPTLVVRVEGRATDHLALVRDTIRAIDPQVPVFAAKTMDQRLDEALARPRFYSIAVAFFAGFALLLAVIGIYGAVSYAVAQRTHELGVRMALGTTARRLRSVLLGQGLMTAGIGAVPGIAAALVISRFVPSLIAGAAPISPSACAASVLLIGAVAAAGLWFATRRIARLDIMDILRAD